MTRSGRGVDAGPIRDSSAADAVDRAIAHRRLDADRLAVANLRRWLMPGIGVKRWLLVTFGGLLILSLGAAHVIRQATRDLEPGGIAGTALDALTFQFLPYPVRGLIVGVVGLALLGFGAYRTIGALTAPFLPSRGGGRLVELIYQRKSLARGPRVVVIGGGTGQSTILRGLKEHTSNLTAIVAVADDGGSSGVLREELGIPPVGDIRRCLAALQQRSVLLLVDVVIAKQFLHLCLNRRHRIDRTLQRD